MDIKNLTEAKRIINDQPLLHEQRDYKWLICNGHWVAFMARQDAKKFLRAKKLTEIPEGPGRNGATWPSVWTQSVDLASTCNVRCELTTLASVCDGDRMAIIVHIGTGGYIAVDKDYATIINAAVLSTDGTKVAAWDTFGELVAVLMPTKIPSETMDYLDRIFPTPAN